MMEWLMWQMSELGPMLGQAHHFLKFNRGVSEYAEKRYGGEAKRLYRVLNTRLDGRDYVVDELSVADIAIWPWASRFAYQEIDLDDYPNVRDWYLRLASRPAFQRGYSQPVDEAIPAP
jgi:GST-like protein